MKNKYKLYGVACSLYTAKARSFLRKQGIDFVELPPTHTDYVEKIMPAIGRMIIPVLETPAGDIIQDGSDIIEYFEKNNSSAIPAYPQNTVLNAVSFLFELFAGEGLLRPAMHYRWNFDEQNIEFLKSEFSPFAGSGASDDVVEQVFEFASSRMRNAKDSFGVSEQSKALVESSYAEFMSLFSEHLKQYPYILGGQASLGDYALMGPLFGHLYRDPAPAMLMRQQAPSVARWVERTNSAQEYWGDHAEAQSPLIDPEKIPTTLKALMRFIAEEYLSEITAHVDFANGWLRERPDLQAGTNGLKDPARRFIGSCEFDWRGIKLNTTVMPYRFYLLQRLQDCYDQAAAVDKKSIEKLFEETGLMPILQSRTDRRVERQDHLEVWGPLLD